MKKNRNLIMRNNWKTWLLLTLVACAGCKRVKHQNTIQDVAKNGDDYTFQITDVETGIQRIYKYTGVHQWGSAAKTYDPDLKYLFVGDEVSIYAYALGSDEWYQDRLVLTNDCMVMTYNQDSVSERKKRELFNRETAKFDSLKQGMRNNLHK